MAFLDHYPLKENGVADYERFSAGSHAFKRAGAEHLAKVALVFSRASRDWNTGVSFEGELYGTAQALEALANGGVLQMVSIAGRCNEFGALRTENPFEWLKGCVIRCPTPWATPFAMSELCSPRVCEFNPDPVKEAEFRREVGKIVGDYAIWETDAPDKVFATLWKERDGAVAIQFLNGTGGGWPPGEKVAPTPRGAVFPPLDRDVAFSFPFGGTANVVVAGPDIEGEVSLNSACSVDGTVSAVLPRSLFRTYAIVRLRNVNAAK